MNEDMQHKLWVCYKCFSYAFEYKPEMSDVARLGNSLIKF